MWGFQEDSRWIRRWRSPGREGPGREGHGRPVLETAEYERQPFVWRHPKRSTSHVPVWPNRWQKAFLQYGRSARNRKLSQSLQGNTKRTECCCKKAATRASSTKCCLVSWRSRNVKVWVWIAKQIVRQSNKCTHWLRKFSWFYHTLKVCFLSFELHRFKCHTKLLQRSSNIPLFVRIHMGDR